MSGIGPKVALSVLSGIEPAEFVRAVLQADAARLTSIPGIGRKTAERITLELRDRLPAIEPSLAAAASEPSTPASGLRDDVMSALVNLGYQRPAVEKAVDAAAKAAGGGEPPAFEDWLRQSLRHFVAVRCLTPHPESGAASLEPELVTPDPRIVSASRTDEERQ